jgi:hypothetical protein
MYDEEYQRIFDNPHADENPVTKTLEADHSRNSRERG